MSAYQPRQNNTGKEKVWNQHQCHLHSEKRNINLIAAFDKDLNSLLLTWIEAGDQIIIGMDTTEEVHTGPLSTPL